ncbi:MAG TPA: MFS transporter [Thermoanaerobaculia bacterium]|nr:MFS transporter [Thermoanaerobaculia bacterium]HUM29925.1 MFS transporter [Thermoanaerobaculia bacterium]HXK68208.1 MFS transporter [Thermoanaerobaculia bacterium]
MFRRIFVNSNIALLFWGQVISQAGDSMYQIGLIWLVLELTGSRTITGVLASCSYLPFLLFALPAGALADRRSRKGIMLTADLVRFFLVLTIPILYSLGFLTIPILAVITFFVAGFASLFYPGRDAYITELASEEDLSHVNALIQTSWQLAVLLGPALAAILLPHTGVIHLFTADSLTYLLSFTAILLLKPLRPFQADRTGSSGTMKDMTEGISYVLRDPRIRVVILITALNNLILMGPAIVGIPIFVRDVLKLDAIHYAWTEAALAGGVIIGAPLMAYFGKRLHLGRALLWGVFLDGITYLPLFFIRSFTWTMIAIFFHSIFIPLVTVTRTTLIQVYVPDRLRGRVFSIILMCVIGGSAISSALTGILSEWIPIPRVFLGMSLLAASCALPGIFSPALLSARGPVRSEKSEHLKE